MSPKAWTTWALVGIALFFLYLFGLDRTGLLGPDEPRYAAIGREMAQSGDWVTPRLFGQPWFEKPPLLYWMTAAGFEAGLNDDLAPRVPVAILSVAFLVFFFLGLRRVFGPKAAAYGACILATSAGWLAYSHIAVTDLPMSAAFAAAMLLVVSDRSSSLWVPFLLGVAILGKGLAPLALFIPALWYLRNELKTAVLAVVGAILVALPWYWMVTYRNGTPFLEEFFWKQHFLRFATSSLQHVRPFWFFIPVLLAGLFPWTPTLVLLFRRSLFRDPKVQFLAAWALFGLVVFSASQNKLPGYVLPILPAITALCGIALAEARRAAGVLSICGVLLLLVPAIEQVLPQALVVGLRRAPFGMPLIALLPVAAVAVLCWAFESRGRRDWAMALIAVGITISVVRLSWSTFPILDRTVSARKLMENRSIPCASGPMRSWRYGLEYYRHHPIPDCK